MKRVIVFNCGCFINEIAGLFYPKKVTIMLLKINYDVKKGGVMYDSFKTDHVRKIYVKKRGKGMFGNPIIPNYVDYFMFALKSFYMLPFFLLKYDVFLFNGPPFFESIMAPILRLFGKKVIIYSNDAQIQVALDKKNVSLAKKIMISIAKVMEDFSIFYATKVFAVSKFLVDYYKRVNKNVVHVPNGADVESIEKIKPKRKFKEYTITYLGGFERFRGIDILIDAFKIIRKNTPVKLFLMGGGPDLDRIREIAGKDKDIVFTGFIEHTEAMSYVKGSDITVMPSRKTISSETISSIKCFEYAVCEVPHVVTDSGEHAYWTEKLGTGLVVKDNAEDISKAIKRLMEDNGLYNKLKENCIKHKNDLDYKKFKKIIIEEALK